MRYFPSSGRSSHVISNKRLMNVLSAIVFAVVVGCARAPEAPPTAAAPSTAAKPAQTSVPAATTAPAAAAPTAAKPAPTAAPASATPAPAAAAKGGELVVGKDQEGPGLDPAKNPAQAAIRI